MSISPRRRFEGHFVALLVMCDLLVCATALALSYGLRAHYGATFLTPLRHPPLMYVQALPAVLALWFVVFASMGMYEPRRTLSAIAARAADFRAASLAALMIAAMSFLSHRDYSRLILLEFWSLALILTWVTRALLGRYYHGVLASGRADSRALIVGCGDLGRIVLTRLQDHHFGLEAVGFVCASEAAQTRAAEGRNGAIGNGAAVPDEIDGVPVLGAIPDLPRLLAEYDINEVLVADPAVPAGELMEAIGGERAPRGRVPHHRRPAPGADRADGALGPRRPPGARVAPPGLRPRAAARKAPV